MRSSLMWLVVAVAACGKSSSAPATPSNTGDHVFDERQGCSVDADCVVVEIECCDHCNGGTIVGVHRDSAAEIRRTYTPASECQSIACTKMACVEPPVAICRRDICGVRVGDREEVPALPPP